MANLFDRIIYQLALQSHGACTRRELIAAGLSSSSIDRRIASGLLSPRGNGVYLADGFAGLLAELSAATKTVGALASHFSAAYLHQLPVSIDQPEVTTPRGTRLRSHHLSVHQSRHLPVLDHCVVNRIPATTLERTLCDIIPLVSTRRSKFLLDRALSTTPATEESVLACHLSLSRRGRSGTVSRRRFLDLKLGTASMSESELELALYQLLVAAGISGFVQQFRPPWFDGLRGRVDFGFPTLQLIIEADGRSWHSSQQAMDDDRRRDRAAVARGWVVLRFTWYEITHRGSDVITELATVIERQAAAAGLPPDAFLAA